MKRLQWPWADAVKPDIYKKRTNWPKISIVTPSYNQGQYIEETILSVLNQSYPNLEYIVIDGGSTDNTIEVIKKYEDKITYWISEPDNGQADAIKKGLAQCTGDIFNWINSDDYLTKHSLFNIVKNIPKDPSILYGNVLNFSHLESSIVKNENIQLQSFLTNRNFSYHQPGIWFYKIPLSIIDESIDIKFHYVFDHALMAYVLKKKYITVQVDAVLVNFRLHETSKTVTSSIKFHNEFYLLFNSFLIDKDFHIYFNEIKNSIQYFKIKWEWKDNISEIITSKNQNNVLKTISLIKLIITCPRTYFNRITFGAIKQLCLKA